MTRAWTAERLLECAMVLPSPSPVLARLIGVLSDPEGLSDDVADIARLDPALVAHLIRVANSVYYRRKVEVTTIDRAVFVLGRQELTRITLARLAGDLFPATVTGYGFNRHGMWQRSVRTAVAAEILARRDEVALPGVAYTAGLLLDIGKLALAPVLEQNRDAVLAQFTMHPNMGFDEAERRVLGADHALLGAWLARRWGFPEVLCQIIEHHHRPARAPEALRTQAYLAHLADALALMTGGAAGVDGLQYPLCEHWPEVLPLSQRNVMDLLVDIDEGFEAAFRVLSLH